MDNPTTMTGTVGAAPVQNVTGLISTAFSSYPFAGIGSTEYAARLIAARCGVSPTMARQIVELGGIGGEA